MLDLSGGDNLFKFWGLRTMVVSTTRFPSNALAPRVLGGSEREFE